MQKISCLCVVIWIFLFSTSLLAGAKKHDLRIVIDVSGSMKKTDPSNLRVVALKMVNGLIPTGSMAGIWTFGRYVDMTVKWGKVNEKWRKLADLGAEEIHSNALFTNIESALARSSKGWEKPDSTVNRSLILLTDGQVDISKNPAINKKSRNNVLQKSIQKLRKNGVHVHAIALSQDTDEVLLSRIALETNGSFEIAESAADLQKVFFKMFERAVQPDTVKIDGNQFSVDSKIKEMTLLIFPKPDSKKPRLFPPEGKAMSARRAGQARWRSDEGYDLVTVKNPATGTWTIDADIDPNSRLMVVTDLSLGVSELPTYLTPAKTINLSVGLFNKGEQISKNSFLRFVDFKISYTNADGKEIEQPLVHSEDRSHKGQYLFELKAGLPEGKHSFKIMADSQTFNRSKMLDVMIQWPVDVAIDAVGDLGTYQLSISAREEYLKPSINPSVSLEAPDGSNVALTLDDYDDVWKTKIVTELDGIYKAMVKIEGETQGGETARYDLGGFPMVGVFRPVPTPELEVMNDDGIAKSEAGVAAIDGPEDDSASDWVFNAILIGAANLILMTVGIVTMLILRRKKKPPELSLE